MTEREKWDRGVAAVRKEYAGLSPLDKAQVGRCATAIKSLKKILHRIAEEVGAAGICAQCFGECCKSGKNHFKAVDLFVYLNDEKELFTPCFERGICPYLGACGCLMGPEFRPYNCITFICERVEELLGAAEMERFYAVERELRSLYDEMELLFENSFRYALLSVCERQNHGQCPV
jgi:hypothetical protein